MSENPYRLARDIRGIGFKTADAIATKLGIEKTAMVGVRAGISYAFTEAVTDMRRRARPAMTAGVASLIFQAALWGDYRSFETNKASSQLSWRTPTR
jgi:hypothetical protein